MTDEVEILESIIIPKRIRYKGIVWIPESGRAKKQPKSRHADNININFIKPTEKHVKQSYLVKWINKNKKVGDIFSLNDFFKEFPKHKTDSGYRTRLDKVLSDLITERKISQLENDTFKVLK